MHGHVNPTLGFTQELVARGHQVSFYSTPEFATSVTATGAQFIPYASVLGKEIGLTAKIQAEHATAGKPPPKSMSMAARFISEFSSTFTPLFEHLSQEMPDLIVYDFVSLASWIVARHLNIKTIKFYTTYASNSHYNLMRETFAKYEQPNPEELHYVQNLVDGICKQHRCASVPLSTIMEHVDADNLVFMPRSFQPFGETFDQRFHFVGPCIRPAVHSATHSIIPAGSGPILIISLGSLYHQWPEFYRDCLVAFGSTSWRVVMATGNLDARELGPIPSNFSVMPHIPQIELLANASLFISHGGMNSTMEAASFGVPLIVIPQIEEQEVTAMRVQEAKLGRYLKRSEVTARVLREAADEVLASRNILQNMAQLQEDIKQSGGSSRVCDLVESRLSSDHSSPQAVSVQKQRLTQRVPL